jgi:hypothetical protein
MATAEPKKTADAGTADRTEPDWTDQVTDLIVDSVDMVRARTTGPLLDVSRAAVLALVAVIVFVPVLVIVVVGLTRFLHWLLPGGIWVSYLVMGALFVLLGALLWSRRRD